MSNSATFVATPKVTPFTFLQGTDTAATFKTVFTAGASGSKVVAIVVSTTDPSAAHLMTLRLLRSAVGYPLVNVNLPLNSGLDGVASAVNMLNPNLLPGLPIDNDGQQYLFLESGDTLEMTFATALTSGKSIYGA